VRKIRQALIVHTCSTESRRHTSGKRWHVLPNGTSE